MVACLSLAAKIPPFFVLMKQVHRKFLARAVSGAVAGYFASFIWNSYFRYLRL